MQEGFQTVVLPNGVWHLPPGYRQDGMRFLGGGQFGQVAAVNGPDGAVAIKKFTRPFQDASHAARTYTEVAVLAHLAGGDSTSVMQLFGLYTPQLDAVSMADLYLVSELADTDLRSVLQYTQLTEPQIKVVTWRLLSGIQYIHSCGIIHRDIKPENVAVFADCRVRIIDFGLARSANVQSTPYVQTRYYRAPEIVSLCPYDHRADVWSFGCILAECFSREITFEGSDTVNQFVRIFEYLGTPPNSFLDMVPTETIRSYITALGEAPKQQVAGFVSNVTPAAADLLEHIFVYDPTYRMTAEQALQHSFFDEARLSLPLALPPGQPFEAQPSPDKPVEELRQMIYDLTRHPALSMV